MEIDTVYGIYKVHLVVLSIFQLAKGNLYIKLSLGEDFNLSMSCAKSQI